MTSEARKRTSSRPSSITLQNIGFLSNLNPRKLFRAMKRVKEEDEIAYRRPYSNQGTRQYQRFIKSKPSRDSLRITSSEESIEYEPIRSYEIGCLGLMSVKKEIEFKEKHKIRKTLPPSDCKNRQVNIDLVVPKILSDVGLLNKFENASPCSLALRPRCIRRKRQYYSY